MSLEILSIKKHGDAKNEYVMLKATADINLFDYAILDTTFNNGKTSNIMRHYFRFPKLLVKKDERVALNTRKGTYSKGLTSLDNVLHNLYWNSDAPIWNDDNPDLAELLKVATISKKQSV